MSVFDAAAAKGTARDVAVKAANSGSGEKLAAAMKGVDQAAAEVTVEGTKLGVASS